MNKWNDITKEQVELLLRKSITRKQIILQLGFQGGSYYKKIDTFIFKNNIDTTNLIIKKQYTFEFLNPIVQSSSSSLLAYHLS